MKTMLVCLLTFATLTGHVFAQTTDLQMQLKKNPIDYGKLFKGKVSVSCDKNDFWAGAYPPSSKIRTVNGDYYSCKAYCTCGGYFCTTSTGKKFMVATQCEGNQF